MTNSTLIKNHAAGDAGVFKIGPPTTAREGNEIVLSVELQFWGTCKVLRYRFPAAYEPFLSTNSDPFLIAALFPAMQSGLDIRVEGTISPLLLENAQHFQLIWSKWYPERYKVCRIMPDGIAKPAEPQAEHTAMTFSGGLDSCYTAWKHTRSKRVGTKPPVESALFILGFDIPMNKAEDFHRYFSKVKELTDSIDVDLIPLQFNYREFIGNWEESHGAALASCLHLFSGRFTTGLIASSHSYDSLRFPWGSNALTDALLSSDSLRIMNDGGEKNRWEKAEVVADWESAIKHLRVCYQGDRHDQNCGVCDNCLFTAIAFEIVGKPIPKVLNIESVESAIKQLFSLDLPPIAVVRIEQMVSQAEKQGITAPWLENFRALGEFQKSLHNPTETPTKKPGAPKRLLHKLRQMAADMVRV